MKIGDCTCYMVRWKQRHNTEVGQWRSGCQVCGMLNIISLIAYWLPQFYWTEPVLTIATYIFTYCSCLNVNTTLFIHSRTCTCIYSLKLLCLKTTKKTSLLHPIDNSSWALQEFRALDLLPSNSSYLFHFFLKARFKQLIQVLCNSNSSHAFLV